MFKFSQSTFLVDPSYIVPDEELNTDYIEFIKHIRPEYPELAHWQNSAVYVAWGGYSMDIYAIAWVDWITSRDEGFIAYCYVSQRSPRFDFGGTGLWQDEIDTLGEQQPWNQHDQPDLPKWAVITDSFCTR